MALGKLAIIIGAGIIGSVFTKDGNLSDVTGILSGALRTITKHLHQDKGSSHPRNDQTASLLDQVNNLRDELQALASSKSVTIITGSRSGSGGYGVTAVVVLGASGYAYIRWKGLKISDMMFATRRALSDASIVVGKQVDSVYSSVTDFKQYFSKILDSAYANLEESKSLTLETHEEVSKINQDLNAIQTEISKVHHTVKELETRFCGLESGQDYTAEGLIYLFKFTESMQLEKEAERIQTFSSPPLALQTLPSTSSPSPVASPRVLLPQVAAPVSGLKEISSGTTAPIIKRSHTITPCTSESLNAANFSYQTKSNRSNSSRSSWIPGLGNIFSRNRSTAS